MPTFKCIAKQYRYLYCILHWIGFCPVIRIVCKPFYSIMCYISDTNQPLRSISINGFECDKNLKAFSKQRKNNINYHNIERTTHKNRFVKMKMIWHFRSGNLQLFDIISLVIVLNITHFDQKFSYSLLAILKWNRNPNRFLLEVGCLNCIIVHLIKCKLIAK